MQSRSLFVLCILLVGLSGCSQFWIDGILQEADTVEIQFYGKGDSGITKPLSIISYSDKQQVAEMAAFISKEETQAFKCGYDGTMKFKSNGQVLIDIEFNLHDDCRHVAFALNNKVHFRKLTDVGYQYLKKLTPK